MRTPVARPGARHSPGARPPLGVPAIVLALLLLLPPLAGCGGAEPAPGNTAGVGGAGETAGSATTDATAGEASVGAGTAGAGTAPAGKTSIRVLFAGSLIIPFERLEKEFEAAHPGIDVVTEGHGSIQVIRHVSDLHEQADLLVTADHSLIPLLLYPSSDPETGLPYANWYVIFATNEMAIAYTHRSAFAGDISPTTWPDLISRDDVRLGIADPRLDASGYRALMTVSLAESFLNKPGLFYRTFGTVFRVPLAVTRREGVSVIKVPEVLETKKGARLVLRPYSVELLPLLEAGEIDYAFEYLSVIKQHGLDYVALPPELNLSDPSLAGHYAAVDVTLDFQRFASVKPEFRGEPIRYAATIPSNARQPQAAAIFLAYLLGPEGQRIMAENYQPMLSLPLADNREAAPEEVRALCRPFEPTPD